MSLSDDMRSNSAAMSATPNGGSLSSQMMRDSTAPSIAWPDLTDPTDGMSAGEKLLAGTGMGMASVIRAITPGKWSEAFHLPGSAEEATKINAPLLSTTAGKVGDFAGRAAITAPAMLIPGANTYLGAGLIGGGLGAATTEGNFTTRAKAAGLGALGGMAGKATGDALGYASNKISDLMKNRAATQQATNLARDSSVGLARANGYVLPPQDVNPGMINSALEGFSGKIKTSQAASQRNQPITNALVKADLGLPHDQPITMDSLNTIRKNAGAAYDVVRGSGSVAPGQDYFQALDTISNQANGAAKSFPGLKNDNVGSVIDTLKQKTFDAGDAVDAIGALRDLAGQSYKNGAKAEGAAYKQSASALEDALDEHLQNSGNPQALEDFRKARQLIAKTYTVQGALNPSTGNVNAAKLASTLQQGKPLSGKLKDVATISSAFPKATQMLAQNYNPMSPLDFAVGVIGGAGGYAVHPGAGMSLAAATLARPAVRSMVLSSPAQYLNSSIGSNYSTPISNALPLLGSQPIKDLLQLGSTNTAAQKSR